MKTNSHFKFPREFKRMLALTYSKSRFSELKPLFIEAQLRFEDSKKNPVKFKEVEDNS